MCHGFRLTKRDDYFPVNFDHFWIKHHFWGSWGSTKNWLEPKIGPPLANLVCQNLWHAPYKNLWSVLLTSSSNHSYTIDTKHNFNILEKFHRFDIWLSLKASNRRAKKGGLLYPCSFSSRKGFALGWWTILGFVRAAQNWWLEVQKTIPHISLILARTLSLTHTLTQTLAHTLSHTHIYADAKFCII